MSHVHVGQLVLAIVKLTEDTEPALRRLRITSKYFAALAKL